MYFMALASDYDGTLAEDGRVAPATLEALDLLRQSGRKLILVTGRELPDLQEVFPPTRSVCVGGSRERRSALRAGD